MACPRAFPLSPQPSDSMPLFLISHHSESPVVGLLITVEQCGALCQPGLTISLAYTRGWSQIQHRGASASFLEPVFWAHSLLSPSRERLPLGLAGTLHYSWGQAVRVRG